MLPSTRLVILDADTVEHFNYIDQWNPGWQGHGDGFLIRPIDPSLDLMASEGCIATGLLGFH